MKYTIKDFHAQFPDDKTCLAFLYKVRWPKGANCEKCKHENCFYPIRGRRAYVCSRCGFQLYPTAGTIFHKSPTPLTSWFHAIFLFGQSKNGVSAKEVERHLGVTYKCAWRIAKQIRRLMNPDGEPLSGCVEADETYIGGKRPGKRGRGAAGKTPVFGVVERGGKVKAEIVPNCKGETLLPVLLEVIRPGSMVSTDESGSYNKVESLGFMHESVRHSHGEYARGAVHTNTIEGFWSQFKRSVNGTYHAVSRKHLQTYLDEFSFRYGRRDEPLPPVLFQRAGRLCEAA